MADRNIVLLLFLDGFFRCYVSFGEGTQMKIQHYKV